MSYKLIALDLDGTLFGDDLNISRRVFTALRLARGRGIQITLASGRAYPAMRRWVEELSITVPVVCYQGAVVADPLTHRRIYAHTFSSGLVPALRDFAHTHRVSMILYIGDEMYVENKLYSEEFYDKWFGIPYHVISDMSAPLPADPIKCMFVGSQEELDRVAPQAQAHFGGQLQIVRSHALFLEGLAIGVSKGSALAWVASQLDVAREETLAIGDSDNDREMISWAGLGVAMNNGTSEAKRVADYIAPSVKDDGVAQVIEQFCLGS